ncbi:gene transfer agent family protein [Methylocystis iwaonis]|uniref:Gene transfer agent family protein n=1 Tax=Methylocystis iwaonis TaxID=2885079 RepID=A0ABN6VEB3_9HYPH|nr:gene transfer agent family protein [Methylocystis iwaonis]BDV33924.1 hypothetical protein SS37A_14530 [Methylocystis iwaonis]
MIQKQTCIHLPFAGRKRKFELRIGEIGELERLCNAGIGAIYFRLVSEQWRYDDIRETIRLGLMGGGESQATAHMFVERYIDVGPKREHLAVAAKILNALIEGVDPPKGAGERAEKSAPPATSPPSTKPAAQSDFAPEQSTQ